MTFRETPPRLDPRAPCPQLTSPLPRAPLPSEQAHLARGHLGHLGCRDVPTPANPRRARAFAVRHFGGDQRERGVGRVIAFAPDLRPPDGVVQGTERVDQVRCVFENANLAPHGGGVSRRGVTHRRAEHFAAQRQAHGKSGRRGDKLHRYQHHTRCAKNAQG